MRSFYFLVICLLPLPLFSQTVKHYTRMKKAVEKCPQNVIQMPAQASHAGGGKTILPVSRITVTDVREDTTYIGIQIRLYSSWGNQRCRKILFDKSLPGTFEEYLNHNNEFPVSGSPYTLVCFVKEFRITQRDSLGSSSDSKTKLLYNRIAMKAETFLKHNNDYFPAFKVDTVMLGLIDEMNEFSAIPDMLANLLQTCAAMNVQKVLAKHTYTSAVLEDRYRAALVKPILSANPPAAGIYMSFDEFINNKPGFTKYKLKADKLSGTLYSVSPTGEEELQTKEFGYCDGSIIWLNMGNDFYPLIRRENTFEYFGDYQSINKKTAYNKPNYYQLSGSNAMRLGTSIAAAGVGSLLIGYAGSVPSLNGKVIHQLNLETGEIY